MAQQARSSGGRKLVQPSSSVQAGGCWRAPECTVRAPSCSGSDVRHRKTETQKKQHVRSQSSVPVSSTFGFLCMIRLWTFFGEEKCITYQRHQRLVFISVNFVFRRFHSELINLDRRHAEWRGRGGSTSHSSICCKALHMNCPWSTEAHSSVDPNTSA